ncbi:MAG TPA: hypothetical protein VLT56_03970 [Desulfobacterales bacterium]|jgi:hypothetical protein|nr:hypothetical protein [Desulfobacterales bacterium]HSM89159.1 hypothetical protein [Desulfobacterales bacterium]
MRRLGSIVWSVSFLLVFCGTAAATGEQAMKLRGQNGLSEFAPPEAFLSGNFLADETDPNFIFGKVKDFAKSLSCPATWLIEEAERRRIEARGQQSGPVEYSIYLEADCAGKVIYYIFVDRSFNPDQWMEWRRPFHRTKADPHYKDAKTSLDQAAQNGVTVVAELRFVALNGDLLLKRPEEVLAGELKFQPIYDLKKNQALSK